jgi:hypothetical protein
MPAALVHEAAHGTGRAYQVVTVTGLRDGAAH